MSAKTPFDALVDAARALIGQETLDNHDTAEIPAIETCLQLNAGALAEAREALSKGCSVPLTYDLANIDRQLAAIGPIRSLARAMALELRLAYFDRNLDRAVQVGVDLLELSNACRNGGLVIDYQVSTAYADLAIRQLAKMRFDFERQDRVRIERELARIEREQEPFDAIYERDKQWELIVHGQPVEFKPPTEVVNDCGFSTEQAEAMKELLNKLAQLQPSDLRYIYADAGNRCIAYLRLLRIDLAVRNYCESQGHFPAKLAELSPEYFETVPLDPCTDQPFDYHRFGDSGFALYSPGASNPIFGAQRVQLDPAE